MCANSVRYEYNYKKEFCSLSSFDFSGIINLSLFSLLSYDWIFDFLTILFFLVYTLAAESSLITGGNQFLDSE